MTETEVDIVGLAHDGRGVARIDGKTVFVTGALPGERARIALRRHKRQFDEGELLELLSPSPERVVPRCRHFDLCGGCSLQHMDAAAQIAAKQQVLADNFQRIAKLDVPRWLPPLIGEPWGYRRKGRLSVRYVAKKGRALVGFREKNPRFVADIQHCEVLHPALGPKLGLLGDLVSGLDARDSIAQIEFAVGDHCVALVFRHLTPLSGADRAALVAFAKQHEFAVYLQPGGISSVHPLWPEQPRLAFRLPDENVEFEFQPLDFVQVNANINEAMVARVLALLEPQPQQRILDLFCGLGNFSLPMARHAAAVTGVEGDAGLLRRAAENAARNGIDNVDFQAADLFEDHRGAAWARADWDAILLDPPRAGADKVLAYLPRKSTHRVVYVSCHPGSLARDAAMLVREHGMRLRAAGVMDMFPHTAHVESVALFERDA